MEDQQRLQRRALRVFEELLDFKGAQRFEQAAVACSGDAALLREVRRLLRADDKVRLAIPTRDPNSASVPFPFQPDSELRWVGRRIGAFEIEKPIGGGGMGLVFLANRVDGEVRQQVAIKVMRAVLATSELAARFDREQQILANLHHPNIASFLDAGTTEEGLPFVVMEYVDGTPIDRYVSEQACSVREVITLFADVCSAVQAAHQALVVHRDIKPGNVLVDASGTPNPVQRDMDRLGSCGAVARAILLISCRPLKLARSVNTVEAAFIDCDRDVRVAYKPNRSTQELAQACRSSAPFKPKDR